MTKTLMKSHGILMSAPMILAYMDGRKGQTRRTRGLEDVNINPDAWTFKRVGILDYMTKESAKGKFGAYFESEKIEPRTLSICPVVSPYGGIGDLLYFKETFQLAQAWGSVGDEWIGDELMEWDGGKLPKEKPFMWNLYYRADDKDLCKWWRPSIFMPRWASRICVPITNVRVERLQDISTSDCYDEGCHDVLKDIVPRQWYFQLWNDINGKTFPAEKNPWVWVYEFQKAKS